MARGPNGKGIGEGRLITGRTPCPECQENEVGADAASTANTPANLEIPAMNVKKNNAFIFRWEMILFQFCFV